jgi:hypothetical protein
MQDVWLAHEQKRKLLVLGMQALLSAPVRNQKLSFQGMPALWSNEHELKLSLQGIHV